MSNFLWHFLTKIWKLKFEIEFGISICNASRHHTCNSNAHRRNQFDTDVSNQCVNCRFSILNHSKWTYTQELAKRAYLIIQNQIFEPEKNSFAFMRLFRLWTLYKWATTSHYNIFVHRYSSKSIRTVIWVWWGLGGLCLPSVYNAQTAHLALNCIWNNREKWGYKV